MSVTRTARLLVEKSFIQRFLEALSGHTKKPALLDEFIADTELRERIAAIEAAFPRFEVLVEDVLGEGHKIAVRGTLHGIYCGELAGIAATHKSVTAPFIAIFRVKGGKIEKHWLSVDVFGVLQQLDAMTSVRAT